MKTNLFRFMLVLLVGFLLAFPAPVLASTPQPLEITANLVMTGPSSAAGSFSVSGLFEEEGAASEVFFIADGTIHGIKTLVGANGTITIHFQAQITWTSATSGVAEGRFVIVSGTGDYQKLHGVGTTHALLDLAASPYPTITATYSGSGHFD